MRIKCLILLFLIVACSTKEKWNKYTYPSTNKNQNMMDGSTDTTIVKPILLSYLLNYINDTSIAKHKNVIQMYAIGFFHENNAVFLSISGHCVLPVLSPQDVKDNYQYKGYYLYNTIPVLFYDYKKGYGKNFYDVGKLINKRPEFYENSENRIGFSIWIYKVINDYDIELYKKLPEFRFK